jgi:hypothetical protein
LRATPNDPSEALGSGNYGISGLLLGCMARKWHFPAVPQKPTSRKILDQRVANFEKCCDCNGKELPNG